MVIPCEIHLLFKDCGITVRRTDDRGSDRLFIRWRDSPAPRSFVFIRGSKIVRMTHQETACDNEGCSRRRAACRIPAASAGQTLLQFLTGRFDYHSDDEWRDLIQAGKLLVNDESATEDRCLRVGDRVEYHVPDVPEPAVNSNVKIVYEDDALWVIDKPGDLPVHPAGKYFNHTLWAILKGRHPGVDIRFVNRLDRETSGLLLVAKTAEMCARCADSLRRPDACKEYLALVEGDFPDRLIAAGRLIRRRDSLIRKKMGFIPGDQAPSTDDHGRRVKTRFAKMCGNGELSLVQAWLETGRTHQIRASLESFGFPLAGDKIYGVDETVFLRFIEGKPTAGDRVTMRLPRQALHAARLVFRHPGTGCLHEWRAPLPDDIMAVIKQTGDGRFVDAAELATAGTTL